MNRITIEIDPPPITPTLQGKLFIFSQYICTLWKRLKRILRTLSHYKRNEREEWNTTDHLSNKKGKDLEKSIDSLKQELSQP